MATPNRDDLLLDLDRLRGGMMTLFEQALRERERELGALRHALRLVSPGKAARQARRELEDNQQRLTRAAHGQLRQLAERLHHRRGALEAASPAHILARGYALVSDESGDIIRRRAQLSADQRLSVQLAEDRISVRVSE